MNAFEDDYQRPAQANARVVAEYIYLDARNNYYLKVQRCEDSTFRQQFWFNKEWHSGKPGGRKIPYKLPELIAAPDKPVWICEGEKDAETLTALGLLATTASEGAGKWTSDLAPWFMGRHQVFICQDNDQRGREHAQQVARQLDPIVADVRIVTFNDVPDHEDVTWWLEHGGTKDGLLARAAEAPAYKAAITASPFALPDVETIPRREWLYHPHYIRGYVSLTLAPGGVGKSALQVAEALAMTTGKPLLGVTPQKPLKVWYLNLEDPLDELQRRFAAAAKHHGISSADMQDRLFINSGRTDPFILATEKNRAALVDDQVFRGAINTIRANGIDVVVVDPVVASHRLQENDNAQIDQLARTYAQIAEETQAALMLVHHTRKMGAERGTVDDARGASALLAASRSARLLTAMSAQEARDADIDDRLRRFHFRADHGKANLTPPAEGATWFRLNSVDLGNESRDLDHGDKVGVVSAFTYPTPERLRTSPADLQRILDKVGDGGPWRDHPQASAWVGRVVAEAMGIAPLEGSNKKRVMALVKELVTAGVLLRVNRRDEKSVPRDFIEAGQLPPVEEVRDQNEPD